MIHTIVKQEIISKSVYLDFRMNVYKRLQEEALREIDFMFFTIYGLKFKLEEIEENGCIVIKVILQYKYKIKEEKESSRGVE